MRNAMRLYLGPLRAYNSAKYKPIKIVQVFESLCVNTNFIMHIY